VLQPRVRGHDDVIADVSGGRRQRGSSIDVRRLEMGERYEADETEKGSENEIVEQSTTVAADKRRQTRTVCVCIVAVNRGLLVAGVDVVRLHCR